MSENFGVITTKIGVGVLGVLALVTLLQYENGDLLNAYVALMIIVGVITAISSYFGYFRTRDEKYQIKSNGEMVKLVKTGLENVNTMSQDENQSNIMWMFFNCDEHKNYASMNPIYNAVVYRKRAGRRALWKKIKSELESKAIEIPENNLDDVRKAILEGNPMSANIHITYGYIAEMEEAI